MKMTTTELLVSLKVPDNAAITTFHTLHRMGYHNLKDLERADYYKFEFSGNKRQFEKKISQADILVNANKHKFKFNLEKNDDEDKISVLVQNLGSDSGLLSTLKERLGFKNIKKVEKGVLWTFNFDEVVDKENRTINITKGLLMNENYQKFKLVD